MHCAKFGWHWPSGSGEEEFYISSMFLCYFVIVSQSSQKAETLHLNKLESPSPKNTLCHVWLKLAQWFWRIRSLNFVNVFSLFCNLCRIISHWERERPFIWTNLNPHHQRMLNAKFGWNWPSCYGKEDFLKFCQCNFAFLYYLPLEKAQALWRDEWADRYKITIGLPAFLCRP